MMTKTIDELYKLHGIQRAAYVDDFLAEHGGRLIPCGRCGRAVITNWKPDPYERQWMRCGECIAWQKAEWQRKIGAV